jgi:hypothetical protein
MTIIYDGPARYDPFGRAILYDVRIDDAIVHCSFAKDALAFCVDDSGDPLDTFNSCRLLILAYTKCCLLKRGLRIDGQYTFELGGATEASALRGQNLLQVEPNYEDTTEIPVDRGQVKIDRDISFSMKPAPSGKAEAGGKNAIA